MSMPHPRPTSPRPDARYLGLDGSDCTIAIQALCFGPLETKVLAVTGAAARPGAEHIALRFGRVLLYLEDRAALQALAAAVHQAERLADRTFGEPDDAFTEAARRSRRVFESRGRRLS